MAVALELGDRYQVERRERCGPLSCVYRARDVATGQVVALKVLPHAWRQERASEGFEAAMAAWATLDHAHIIPVRGFGRTSQLLWYAMPHIDGRSLDDLLRNGGPLEPRACLRLVEQLAAALHYAHRRGVTHGNVKPANVMVASAGLALLSDFALARALEPDTPCDAAAARSRLAHYVTPEERHARQLGPAADQYGLAVLALECLEAAAAPDAHPPVPRGVREALTRALSPDPQDRYATVLDLVAALAAGAAPAPPAVSQPAAPVARPPAAPPVLWDDGYEPGGPRGRIVRRLALGAGMVIGLAGATLFGMRLASGPAPARELVTPPSSPVVPRVVVAPVDSLPPRDTTPLPVKRPAPLARRRPAVVAAGRLFVGSSPWGEVYIDGRLAGHTPMAGLAIAAGWHQVRIVRDGFAPFEQRVQVAPGGDARLTGIVLHAP
jgi:serine/threonine-protein kinase